MNDSNKKEAVTAVPVPVVFHFWSPPGGRIILLQHHLESVISPQDLPRPAIVWEPN